MATVLETPHVAVGAAIASKIPNPLISVPLALASHFVLDKIPHWNPHFYTETQKYGYPLKSSIAITAIDVVTALGLGVYVANTAAITPAHKLTILACCFASVLPDVSKGPYFFLKQRGVTMKKWVDFERSLQVDTTVLPGTISQLLVIGASLFWIFS